MKHYLQTIAWIEIWRSFALRLPTNIKSYPLEVLVKLMEVDSFKPEISIGIENIKPIENNEGKVPRIVIFDRKTIADLLKLHEYIYA